MLDILTVETSNGVRTLTLNRPHKRNALNQALIIELLAAFEAADNDEEVACVILTAAGTVFSAGADLGEVKNFANESLDAYEQRLDRASRMTLAIPRMNKPVIAAVNGAAIGAGASLALSADIVLMSQTARLGYPEVMHGMVPISVMPTLLDASPNPKLAFEMLVGGGDVDATRSLSAGLVNQVVADETLQARARELAERIATFDRGSVTLTKRLIDKMNSRPLTEAVEIAAAASRARAQARARNAAPPAQ